MGKATIAGGGEDGLYTIDLDFGRDIATARADNLLAKIIETGAKITEAQGAFDAQNTRVINQTVVVNDAINAYAAATRAFADPADWVETRKVYDEAAKVLLEERSKMEPLRIKLGELQALSASYTKERDYWQSVQVEESRQAWCVDLTEDATGQVGTVDVPGESAQILIVPGGAPPTGQDGLLVAREVQNPNQVFFNAAILPGWQKFKPTYRVGIITAINSTADTADVTLVAATSSAQNLDINRYTSLPDTPITYMTCDSAAFELGDRVVVQFEDQQWNAPKVIGFESNPKACFFSGWGIAGGKYIRPKKWDQGIGEMPYRWRDDPPAGGNLSWFGNGFTVSWWGRVGKHVGVFQASGAVYVQGATYNFTGYVRGACIRLVGAEPYLYVVARQAGTTAADTFERLYRQKIAYKGAAAGAVETVWTEDAASVDGSTSEAINVYNMVSFNSAGTHGVSVSFSADNQQPAWVVGYDGGGRHFERITWTTSRTSSFTNVFIGSSCWQSVARTETQSEMIVAVEYGLGGNLIYATASSTRSYGSAALGASYSNQSWQFKVDGEVIATCSQSNTYAGSGNSVTHTEHFEQLLTLDLRNPGATSLMVMDMSGRTIVQPGMGGPCGGAWALYDDFTYSVNMFGGASVFTHTLNGYECRIIDPYEPGDVRGVSCADGPAPGDYSSSTDEWNAAGYGPNMVFFIGQQAAGTYSGSSGFGWTPGPDASQLKVAYAPNGDYACWHQGIVWGISGQRPDPSRPMPMAWTDTDPSDRVFHSNAFTQYQFNTHSGKTIAEYGGLTVLGY